MFYSDCRLKYHFWGMMTHVFNAILAYIIMLAVMQYNWWIFIAVLLGKYYESLLRREVEKYIHKDVCCI